MLSDFGGGHSEKEQISSELKVFKGEKSGASIRREEPFEIIRDRSQRMSQGWFE